MASAAKKEFRERIRYLVAALMVAYAAAAKTLLPDYLGTLHPLLAFYPFVFVTALYSGLLPGLLATALALIAALRWVEPAAQGASIHIGALVVFILFGTMTSLAGEMRHRAHLVSRIRGLLQHKSRFPLVKLNLPVS